MSLKCTYFLTRGNGSNIGPDPMIKATPGSARASSKSQSPQGKRREQRIPPNTARVSLCPKIKLTCY